MSHRLIAVDAGGAETHPPRGCGRRLARSAHFVSLTDTVCGRPLPELGILPYIYGFVGRVGPFRRRARSAGRVEALIGP